MVGGKTPKQRTITYEDFAAFTLEQVNSDAYLNKPVGIYSDQIMDPVAEIRKYQEKLRQQEMGSDPLDSKQSDEF